MPAIGAVLIVYCIVYLSKWICRIEMLKIVLMYLGNNTLPILCFHLIELTAFPWGHFSMIFEIILIFGFPIICVKLLHKTKCYRCIFG